MLKQKNYPKVYWYDGASYTEVSFFMLNFGRDALELQLDTDHFIYFGKHKPFNALFVEMGDNANDVQSTLKVEYFDGSTWVEVENLVDDSQCFNRAGFIQFDRPDDWSETLVGFDTKHFIRLSVSALSRADMQIQGMNLVFSDDQDLNGIYPGISSYLNATEKTFILRHENSRNLIVQDIRNLGFRKFKERYQNIDAWDLLEVEEVNLWSSYLTLANIFSSLQSNQSDLFKQKAEEYQEMADFYKAQSYLTLDSNDDGKADSAESARDITVRRLVRR